MIVYNPLLMQGIPGRPEPRPAVHAAHRREELQPRRLQGGRPPDPRGNQGGAQGGRQEGLMMTIECCFNSIIPL